jgi:hypothetical protein
MLVSAFFVPNSELARNVALLQALKNAQSDDIQHPVIPRQKNVHFFTLTATLFDLKFSFTNISERPQYSVNNNNSLIRGSAHE